jgi:hypothetical protein
MKEIEQIKENVERMFGVNLKKLPRKKIIYGGVTKDNKSLILISPESKLHPHRGWWVDINKTQRDEALNSSLAIVAFRLRDRGTYYVGFNRLSKYLSEETMMNNMREGDHWKLSFPIRSENIQIQNCDTPFSIRPSSLVPKPSLCISCMKAGDKQPAPAATSQPATQPAR